MSGELTGERVDDGSSSDGRRRRSERSRRLIVEAFLDLLREGAQPSSTQIATRAGCTQRTVFNHFRDMEELLEAVAERQTERIHELLPRPTEGTFDARIDAYADTLAVLLEETMHVRWAVMTGGRRTIGGLDLLQAAHELARQNLETAFADELEAMDGARRATTMDALDIVTDAGVWRIRRLHHDQSVAQARDAAAATLRQALRPI